MFDEMDIELQAENILITDGGVLQVPDLSPFSSHVGSLKDTVHAVKPRFPVKTDRHGGCAVPAQGRYHAAWAPALSGAAHLWQQDPGGPPRSAGPARCVQTPFLPWTATPPQLNISFITDMFSSVSLKNNTFGYCDNAFFCIFCCIIHILRWSVALSKMSHQLVTWFMNVYA